MSAEIIELEPRKAARMRQAVIHGHVDALALFNALESFGLAHKFEGDVLHILPAAEEHAGRVVLKGPWSAFNAAKEAEPD